MDNYEFVNGTLDNTTITCDNCSQVVGTWMSDDHAICVPCYKKEHPTQKQYHYVVCYDEATGKFSLDYDVADAWREGQTIYNPKGDTWEYNTEDELHEHDVHYADKLADALAIMNDDLDRRAGWAYYAQDGNYGSADGIVIVPTYDFTPEECEAIENAGDNERAELAREIAEKHAEEI
jgi:hypothetical protein